MARSSNWWDCRRIESCVARNKPRRQWLRQEWQKINDNGGNTTDYMYGDNGKQISSTSVKVTFSQGGEVSSSFEGYGFRNYNQGTGGALMDPSFAIVISDIGVGLFFKGLGIGAKYFLSRTYNSVLKLHPRLTTLGTRGFGHGQFDAAHRGTAFFQKEIFQKGSFGVKNYNTIYFNHKIGTQNFSTGINPWNRTIFHQGPGIFK